MEKLLLHLLHKQAYEQVVNICYRFDVIGDTRLDSRSDLFTWQLSQVDD